MDSKIKSYEMPKIDSSSIFTDNKTASTTSSTKLEDYVSEFEEVDFDNDNNESFLEKVGAHIAEKIDNVLGEFEWYQDFTDFVDENVAPIVTKIDNVLDRVNATVTLAETSLAEGIADFGESIVDALMNVSAGIVSIPVVVGGVLTGSDWQSDLEDLWDQTKGFVAVDHVGNFFDDMYENTSFGTWLKDEAYGFDTVRNVSKEVGNVVGTVGVSLLTFGVVSPFVVAGISGFGKGTETAWSEGAGTVEGLAAGVGTGLWDGLQFFVGGKIGGATLFGEGGKFLTGASSKAINTNLLNSISRVALDGLDGGAEGFIQPLISSIYKDGYYDDAGNYIKFQSNDNFLMKYGEIFNDYGGAKNVLTNAFIGSALSGLGEVFDLNTKYNNLKAGKEADVKLNNISEGDIPTVKLFNDAITEELASIKNIDTNSKIFTDQSEIAAYFDDPKQFFVSKLESIYGKAKNPTLQEEIMNVVDYIKDTPVRELDFNSIYDAYSKYLSRSDRKTLKKLIMNDKINGYTEAEQDLIQAYTHAAGPALTAYLRKTKTMFSGHQFDGTSYSAMSEYIGRSFEDISKFDKLYQYTDLSKFINKMDSIIEKSSPLKENLTVYRGVDGLFLNGNKISTFDVGQTFDDSAFVSTSLIPMNIANRRPILLEIEVPKGTKAAYLEKYTGVKNYGQQELLLGRNNKFEITSLPRFNEDNGQMVLKARLIPSEESVVSSLSLDKISGIDQNLSYYKLFNSSFDNQVDLYNVVNSLKDNDLLGRFESEIRDLNNSNLYNFDIPEHNIDHVERVLLYSMYMGNEMKLDSDMMDVLIEASKFHDSGRINLATDTNHAMLSANKVFENLEGKYSADELNKIAAVIEYHEAADSKEAFDAIFNKYNIDKEEYDDIYNIATILKDADALDRVRFPGNLDSKYLRNDMAKDLIKSSYQLQEIRGTKEIENNIMNGNYSKDDIDTIVALKEIGVPDYMINYSYKYNTNYVNNIINKIIDMNSGGK